MDSLDVTIDGWEDGAPIPPRFAFGQIPEGDGHFEPGGNRSPAIRWDGAPKGTRCFAIICHDPDVPSEGDDVNKEGREVPADLKRVDFYHWVLVDIPADLGGIEEGAASDGVTAGGKAPARHDHGTAGLNTYTEWFEGDAEMAGQYADYDGPCPPWNDTIVHNYHFTVYALDEETGLEGDFDAGDAIEAMAGHVLAKGRYSGTYTMNPDLR